MDFPTRSFFPVAVDEAHTRADSVADGTRTQNNETWSMRSWLFYVLFVVCWGV